MLSRWSLANRTVIGYRSRPSTVELIEVPPMAGLDHPVNVVDRQIVTGQGLSIGNNIEVAPSFGSFSEDTACVRKIF